MPLASQERVLEAFDRLGFRFKGADVEHGHIHGVAQHLPFYQEIEFYPPAQYTGRINEVELTFVANQGGMAVVLEADKRSGPFGSADQIFRAEVGHDEALTTDWVTGLAGWLDGLAGGHTGFSAGGHGSYGHHGGHDPYGHHGGYGHHDEHGHRHGPGWGGVAAGVAAGIAVGVAGGMIADEIIEEVFEDEDGDADED